MPGPGAFPTTGLIARCSRRAVVAALLVFPLLGTALPAAAQTNNPPTSDSKVLAGTEDNEFTFAERHFTFNDIDGDTLSSVKVTALPMAHGVVNFSGTAIMDTELPKTVTVDDLDNGRLTFVPDLNAVGGITPVFKFKVNDGTDDSALEYNMRVSLGAVNDPATGAPAITGTATVGETLTATQGTIADVEMLWNANLFASGTTTLQWIRVDSDGASNPTEIMGATSATYTLATGDVGKKIKIRVNFQDRSKSDESRSSEAFPSSGTILGTNIPPTSANSEVFGAEDTHYTFLLADFPFTDTDSGDQLENVKIVTLPASGKGVLALGGATILAGALPQTVTRADLSSGELRYTPPANAFRVPLYEFHLPGERRHGRQFAGV